MAVRKIIKMGNPKLATPSRSLENYTQLGRNYPGLKELIEDMQDTMQAYGGIGIAAPQIGENLRVMLFGLKDNEIVPQEKYIPFTLLINPSIEFVSPEMNEAWEGCLSVPGMRGLVPRYNTIKYTGYDLDCQPVERTVTGFHARVFQHEYDHLEGILYPQRLSDIKMFGFEEEMFEQISI